MLIFLIAEIRDEATIKIYNTKHPKLRVRKNSLKTFSICQKHNLETRFEKELTIKIVETFYIFQNGYHFEGIRKTVCFVVVCLGCK
jgi:hypothetical protein